ncbi:PREDICTED: protein S100-A14-like [Cariama cristata]|uniref:protein S100-A14-like n=1 Tax=Cariama cristata TaxID=54380 RepID=UPI000520E206|nr:PREDICTED: protein S100-A14-like [Cariama cristata]
MWPGRRRFLAPRWPRAKLRNETPCTTPQLAACRELPLTPPRGIKPLCAAARADPGEPVEQDCQELTDVERAIETVINQFHCYAVKGQKEYLTPNEMQELVVQKLPHLGKCVGPLDEKIECMGDPDEAKLEFGEYWDMMGDAAKGCRRK